MPTQILNLQNSGSQNNLTLFVKTIFCEVTLLKKLIVLPKHSHDKIFLKIGLINAMDISK